MPPPRNTSTRDALRRAASRGHPNCALCGGTIDYTIKWPDPQCFVADHITPREHGGTDTPGNVQAAHAACNRAKGYRLDGGPVLRRSGALRRGAP